MFVSDINLKAISQISLNYNCLFKFLFKWIFDFFFFNNFFFLFRALVRYIKILKDVRRLDRGNTSLGEIFIEYVKKHPNKPCLICDGVIWTFQQINDYSNQLANFLQAKNYKKGDTVALFMENRPEFVASWLGISKLGIVIPLVNINQRQKSLIHSITIVNCKAVIFSESLKEAIYEITSELPSDIQFYQYNDNSLTNVSEPFINLRKQLNMNSISEPVIKELSDKPGHHDKLVYIYTSGTTGLPKAAVLNHARFVFIALGMHYMGDFTCDDIFYTPLPLYHTAGGVMSIGQAILFGSTVVIRKKFSASGFFPDCEKYKCTVSEN